MFVLRRVHQLTIPEQEVCSGLSAFAWDHSMALPGLQAAGRPTWRCWVCLPPSSRDPTYCICWVLVEMSFFLDGSLTSLLFARSRVEISQVAKGNGEPHLASRGVTVRLGSPPSPPLPPSFGLTGPSPWIRNFLDFQGQLLVRCRWCQYRPCTEVCIFLWS